MIKNNRLVMISQLGTPISRFLMNNINAEKFTITLQIKDNNHPRMIIKPFIS
jgi:hypothetical protein